MYFLSKMLKNSWCCSLMHCYISRMHIVVVMVCGGSALNNTREWSRRWRVWSAQDNAANVDILPRPETTPYLLYTIMTKWPFPLQRKDVLQHNSFPPDLFLNSTPSDVLPSQPFWRGTPSFSKSSPALSPGELCWISSKSSLTVLLHFVPTSVFTVRLSIALVCSI